MLRSAGASLGLRAPFHPADPAAGDSASVRTQVVIRSMIVTPQQGELLIVTQNDHAAFAAELLSLWRTHDLPRHPRRDALLYAVREHDNGWYEADSAPRLREDGRPHDFLSVPGEWRREIWHRGIHRHAEKRPFVTLLILEHALAIHRSHTPTPEWHDTLASWQELRSELLFASSESQVAGEKASAGFDIDGKSETVLSADYRFLDLVDTLSLAVCTGRQGTGEHGGVRYRATLTSAGATLELDPFPLAGTTTFRLACRRIPDHRYASDADLGVTLVTASWLRLPLSVRPFDCVPSKDPIERVG